MSESQEWKGVGRGGTKEQCDSFFSVFQAFWEALDLPAALRLLIGGKDQEV